MNFKEMEVFRHVMATGSVIGAATALNISQPAVSQMLKQAEGNLGFKLFTRQKKRLIPTSEAHALLPEVLGAFGAINSVARLAADIRAGRSGRLTIAAAPTIAHGLLPLAVRQFQEHRPDVAFNLRSATAEEVIKLVADHRVDLGFILGNIGDARILSMDLQSPDIACVLPPNHVLSERQFLSLGDLAGVPLVTVFRHLPIGSLLAQMFEDANIPQVMAAEVSQSSLACAMANAGVGIAVVDGFAAMAAQSMGMKAVPFRPAASIPARILYSRQQPLSNLARDFTEMLLDFVPGTAAR